MSPTLGLKGGKKGPSTAGIVVLLYKQNYIWPLPKRVEADVEEHET